MPKYMLLLHDNTAAFANVSPDQMQKVVEKYIAWGKKLREAGVMKAGDKLTDEPGQGDAPHGRPGPRHRRTVQRVEGSAGRLLHDRSRQLRQGDRTTRATARSSTTAARSKSGRST